MTAPLAPEIWLVLVEEVGENPVHVLATLDPAEAFASADRTADGILSGELTFGDTIRVVRFAPPKVLSSYYRQVTRALSGLVRRTSSVIFTVTPWHTMTPAGPVLADVPLVIRQLADTRRERLMIAAERLMALADAEGKS